MKIRNLQLTRNGSTRFNFPLDERESTVAHELIHHADGKVLNPVWIRDEHYTWKEEEDLLLNGYASVAFDPKTERLFIADGDSLLTWTVPTGHLSGSAYATGPQPLLRGNQSLYSSSTNSLYNLYIDQSLVTAFDFNRSVWDKDHHPGPVTDYWHFNKFFSPIDTSLYLLGGYGHFQYRNIILRYHLSTQNWDTITPTGDRLVPRYLFALGTTASSDSVYILGGYGSQTGQQILNPQNIYDMMVLDVRNKKLKKLFELQPKTSDFAFANSLVLDSRKRNYYGLAFPNSRYASHLQLIRGSLDGPGYQAVGDTIPYSFHDVTSASDLYFAPLSNKFLAITQLIDTLKRTHLHIFSLTGPPVTSEIPYPTLTDGQSSPAVKYVWDTLLLALIGAGIGFIVKRKIHPSSAIRQSEAPPAGAPFPSASTPIDAATQTGIPIQTGTPTEPSTIPDPTNTLFLFGEMQIFDKDGIDITRQFTPLIRELFLLILLYSVRKGTGVSSDKLTEVLWSDKSTQAARNNRSVNIAKLKTLLDRLEGVHLSKETGYWKIDLDPVTTRLDYQTWLNIVKDKNRLNKQRINELAEITQRGGFLTNIEYEWLDDFKSEVSNTIIDTYLHFAQSIPLKEDPDFLVRLANYVFYFDPVNEEAITIKCKALAATGKHSLAKNAFDGFARQYRTIYGEDYGKDFQTLLEDQNDH
jgi:DNA-binding SARP family transcriptional activator